MASIFRVFTAASLLFSSSLAQSPASTYVQPNVPTGTPLPANYTGQYRPQVHFSPPSGFMNDPNGMFVDANGTWHLYYQYNPTATVAGNQHWGHATSTDLYHWINQPIALFPPRANQFVFSGSAIIDGENTSGFFPDQDNGVVAVYTLAEYFPEGPGPQTQNIALSYDGGYTFTPWEGNPVIDSESSQFRDPKVIRYENHWVMVIAYSVDFAIGIFTSDDLKSWTATSNFSYHGLLGLQYECPNMVEMPVDGTDETMWLMYLSINPGAPLGGSVGQYWPGHFNGTHFTAVDAAARIADFGKDNYAGQFFYGTPRGESAVSMAWASNWQYTNVVPTAQEGWRSVMSLPRRNFIANYTRIGYQLFSQIYDISPVLGEPLAQNSSLGNGTILVDYSNVYSNALYFEVNVTNIPRANVSSAATLNLTFFSPISGESVRAGMYLGGDAPFFIDRSGARAFDNPFYTDKFSFSNLLTGSWRLSGVIDRSILEVFLNGGAQSATNTYFADQPLTVATVKTASLPAGVEVSVAVWSLDSAWQSLENDEGTVVGNATDSGNSTIGRRHAAEYKAAF